MAEGKYVFFDIDGTIYDYHKGVSESARTAICRLRERGHHPILCTGRTRALIFDEILEMGFDGMVAGGGTYVEWDGNVIYREELDPAEVDRLVELFRNNGFASYPEGIEDLYYDPEYVANGADAIYRIYQVKIPGRVRPIEKGKVRASKVSAMYTEASNTEAVIREVEKDYIWADHSGQLFETIPIMSSKGKGVQRLMDYLGADMEDTYGFGDSYNDLAMLRRVKYGVAMGNASDSLKRLVPYQTESMDEDGVYKALVRFGLI